MAKKFHSGNSLFPSGEGKYCNMPSESTMKPFAKAEHLDLYAVNGSIQEIDRKVNHDIAKIKSQLNK